MRCKNRQEYPEEIPLAYRNTPQQGRTYSPAQRLMSRRLRDLISVATSQLRPQPASPSLVVQDIAGRKKSDQRCSMTRGHQYHRGSSHREREY